MEMDFLPAQLHRGVAPEALQPNMARILQNVDVSSLQGRIRRAPGYARLDVDGESTTISSCGVFQRRDGKRILVWSNTNGDVKMAVSTNQVENAGPLPLWVDVDSFGGNKTGTVWIENFEEDGNLNAAGGGTS